MFSSCLNAAVSVLSKLFSTYSVTVLPLKVGGLLRTSKPLNKPNSNGCRLSHNCRQLLQKIFCHLIADNEIMR